MDENILNIINFLEFRKEVLSSAELYYSDIYKRLSNNIFELLEYEFPVPSELNDDYQLLIRTLNVLRNNKFVYLNGVQINTIIRCDIYQSCLNYVSNKIENFRKNRVELIDDLIDDFKSLNGKIVDDELINKFYDFLEENKVDFVEAEKYCIGILNYNSSLYDNIIVGLDYEALSSIFEKYGYSFDKVPEEYRNLLLVNGNLSNIESLFIKFSEYNIPFYEKNVSFIYFLIKSDVNVLDKMFIISQKYGYDIIDLIKKIPSAFIHKNLHLRGEDKTGLSNSSDKSDQVVGSYEDFERLVSLFESIGYSFSTVFEKCPSIFVTTYEKIKKNVDLLLQYGFSQNLCELGFKLSAFKSENILFTLDRFIELDELDYVRDNTSRLVFNSDSYIFYRLYFAKKFNREHYDNKYVIKRQFKNKEVLTGIIYDKENKVLDPLIDMKSVTNYVFSDVIDSEIKSFISSFDYSSCSEVNDDVISLVDGNIVSELEYKFDDIIISRPKVIRVYSALVSHYGYDRNLLLLFALTYNSILDHDEFEVIKSYVKGREK